MIDRDQLADTLELMCPMFVLLDPTGHIVRVGPTLQKLRPDMQMAGERFLELFELTRPRAVANLTGLLANAGTKLHLQFRDEPRTSLKGVIVPVPDGTGAIVNLSFGISVLDAVRDYALTSADFSATDLTIELLYLVEAKSAAMEASRKLNLRLQGAMIAAEEQAFTDTLTGLKNRRAMDHVLARMVASPVPFALMNLDLDFFKAVNDTMGHAAGDHVLQQAARIMVEETRDEDMVARVGGDEFVLVFNRLLDRKKLARIARRMIDRLEEPIQIEGQTCQISASIGTVFSNQSATGDPAELLHKADIALYKSKRAGRACHTFYSSDLTDSSQEPVPSSSMPPETSARAAY
ncbi:GGDEF domain-containing protein [Sedimentitalea nanhaiensis]|uniref:Diguanylate cyclase (GGDEF) domain-containing protein n=1 Tax=Sedimentitalea nanhaiensis TaxID=999627 RepID=A0A1I6ZWE8_9RHOB|nr:GGDEF domain-containing protein [Sedimentitalea nanhaiensis]SFT66982.1 diguanylate cyclase (GGDEF) domain-containing protein [Sedimentitalea nanhaiensis]